MAKPFTGSGRWRTALEVGSALVAAIPIGIFLYFMSVLVWAEVVTILAIPISLIPSVSAPIMGWLNFSQGAVPFIIGMAVAMELGACRILIRYHYQAFAYTQALLGLAVSSPFFYWTVVHQKPMIPFWGR